VLGGTGTGTGTGTCNERVSERESGVYAITQWCGKLYGRLAGCSRLGHCQSISPGPEISSHPHPCGVGSQLGVPVGLGYSHQHKVFQKCLRWVGYPPPHLKLVLAPPFRIENSNRGEAPAHRIFQISTFAHETQMPPDQASSKDPECCGLPISQTPIAHHGLHHLSFPPSLTRSRIPLTCRDATQTIDEDHIQDVKSQDLAPSTGQQFTFPDCLCHNDLDSRGLV
jgi:hypothetical protein